MPPLYGEGIRTNTTMDIKDKSFDIFIDKEKISTRVEAIAKEINRDYEGKNPLFIAIMNGAFMFAADLMKHVNIPCEITFIKVSSYQATQSTGNLKELVGLQENIFKRDIILVEDIVDTGNTLSHLTSSFTELGPSSVEIATLLFKPEAIQKEIDLKYVGFSIPNKFVVGYGLDYDGYGRNTNSIYKLVE